MSLGESKSRELALLRKERELRKAVRRGKNDAAFFVETFCRIEDRDAPGVIVPFALWPAQKDALSAFSENRLSVVLKARQLGLTWGTRRSGRTLRPSWAT